jgi:hypothetical protein
MSSYSYINAEGQPEGRYKGQSPSVVAKKIFKKIYQEYGKTPKYIVFKKNDYLGDAKYKYQGKVEEFANPRLKQIGNKTIEEKYKVHVKRIPN